MRLLRNKWNVLKCGRMNYWKESVFVVLLAVVVVVGLALRVTASQTDKGKSAQKITASGGKQTGTVKNVGDKNSTGDMPQTAGKSIQTAGQNNVVKPEDAVYTFLQGPKSWGKRLTWSGKWAETYYDGGKFGAFGCGFCCMANIYSSQTTYEASPVDIYKYTKRNTIYGGGGAVAWEYMESAMQGLGFEVSLRRKPTSYRKFQKMIGLMILVKSGVHKILFSLRLTVITVCHHQIPVNFFLHDILRYVEGIFAFAHILDNGSSGTAFLQNLTERGLLKLLALLHGSFREYPSFIFIFIIFIKQKDLPPKNYYTAAARCFYHCNSSCRLVCL